MDTSRRARIPRSVTCGLVAAATLLIATALTGCVSDSARSIGATRPECLVNEAPISTARDTGMSARERDCASRQESQYRAQDKGMELRFGRKND